MDYNVTITVNSLRAFDVHDLFDKCFDRSINFQANSLQLSGIDGDVLAGNKSVSNYVCDYFLGAKTPTSMLLNTADVKDLHPLEAYDLLYRCGALGLNEAWVINRVNSFISSRRVFVVSALLGHNNVVDCFVEAHSAEWFGDLIALIPKYDEAIFQNRPYMISADRSAKKMGAGYFLHSGTNAWNRAWLPTTEWSESWENHLRVWKQLIVKTGKLAQRLQVREYQCLFVPEKDTLARIACPGVLQSGMLPMLVMCELMGVAPENKVLFPVKELITRIEPETRTTIPDSHLAAEDYWEMFRGFMHGIGLAKYTEVNVEFGEVAIMGDLGNKFGKTEAFRQTIHFDMGDAEQTYGDETLQIPLRTNHVEFENSKAPIKKTLLILGDSHSSVGTNPFLTYIARHFFKTVEFCWNPFNIHNVPVSDFRQTSYDYLLCETSQRFATPTV